MIENTTNSNEKVQRKFAQRRPTRTVATVCCCGEIYVEQEGTEERGRNPTVHSPFRPAVLVVTLMMRTTVVVKYCRTKYLCT